MSPISELTINFNKSPTYLHLALIIHLFAWIVIFQSSLPSLLIFIATLVLGIGVTYTLLNPTPMPLYRQLMYNSGQWLLLYREHGEVLKYDRVSIGFDGGLFLIVVLTGKNPRKNLIIFKDQLTKEQNRCLHLMKRINEAKPH